MMQEELNDFERGLGPLKDGAELLTSFMNKRTTERKMLKLIISETDKKILHKNKRPIAGVL